MSLGSPDAMSTRCCWRKRGDDLAALCYPERVKYCATPCFKVPALLREGVLWQFGESCWAFFCRQLS